MLHQAFVPSTQGNYQNIMEVANRLKKLEEKIHYVVSSNLNIPIEKIRELSSFDNYLDAEKAFELEVVGNIV